MRYDHLWRKARPAEEIKKSPNYRETLEERAYEDAVRRTVLWHYTNMEALLKIMSNKTLRFSRIDCVNDLTESRNLLLGDYHLKTYISCFCHDSEESIPLWKMYTSKGLGVRIELQFNRNNIHLAIKKPHYKIEGGDKTAHFISKITDIVYSEQEEAIPISKADAESYDVLVDYIAYRKSPIWVYENETRIIMVTRDKLGNPPPRYVDFSIDFSRIECIKIVFDPWMTDEVKHCIELAVNEYLIDYKDFIELQFLNSVLQGTIRS